MREGATNPGNGSETWSPPYKSREPRCMLAIARGFPPVTLKARAIHQASDAQLRLPTGTMVNFNVLLMAL